jgi:hypothetical protein
MMEEKIILQTSINMTPHDLFGSERLPDLGTGTHWLA